MTPKELYDWAVEHGSEDYDLLIGTYSPEGGERRHYIDEECATQYDRQEIIVLDI